MKIMIMLSLLPLLLLSDMGWSQAVTSDQDRIKALEETVNALIKEGKELHTENEQLRIAYEQLNKELRAENEKLKLQILDMLEVELRKRIPEMHKEIVGLLQQILYKGNRRLFGTATATATRPNCPVQGNPQDAIDGNVSTGCRMSQYGFWNWSVDLGGCFQINHITIFGSRFDANSRHTVVTLTIQDENQKEVYSKRFASVPACEPEITIPDITGHFVRLESSADYLLSEVFIYGAPAK